MNIAKKAWLLPVETAVGGTGEEALTEQWTSLAAFMLILLLAGAADGLMEALGPAGFLLVGGAVLGAAWALTEVRMI